MKNLPLLLITIGFTVLMILGIGWFFGNVDQSTEITDEQKTQNAMLARSGGRHILGELGTAPVEIIEFSDFQCPACKATAPLVKAVKDEFGDQVVLVFRHLPLESIHPNAFSAAKAAEAAAKQDAFWDFHDKLFTNQSEWEALSEKELQEKFLAYARDLKLNEEQFNSDFSSEEASNFVESDLSVANQLGLSSTPSFVVNGKIVNGGQLREAVLTELQTSSTVNVEPQTMEIDLSDSEPEATQSGN